MPADYEDKIEQGPGGLVVNRRYFDGSDFTFTGDRALAMADTPEAAKWRAENPEKALLNSHSPFDSMEEMHPWAYSAREFLNKKEDGILGTFAEKGILPGAAAGGVAGAGAGALASLLAKLFLGEASTKRWAMVGGALGALLGGHNGYVRSNMNKALKDVPFTKASATYMDPRNFILEKLQGATDVSIGEKVKLAAAVRNLNRADAEKLASMVRAALGFGVGAIIAKFVLGTTSAVGTLFGGVLGALGTSMIANSLAQTPQRPTFDFNFKPLSYRDIL